MGDHRAESGSVLDVSTNILSYHIVRKGSKTIRIISKAFRSNLDWTLANKRTIQASVSNIFKRIIQASVSNTFKNLNISNMLNSMSLYHFTN
jgi:hypothetical protein